jgi:5-methylcytosine-specific restriction endonuclease McrA
MVGHRRRAAMARRAVDALVALVSPAAPRAPRNNPDRGKSRPKRQKGAEGRSWRRLVPQVVQRDKGKCWICTHYGAKSADHVVPDAEGGTPTMDNLKAAHGYPNACPVCSDAAGEAIYCNQIKHAMSLAHARRLIEERTGLTIGDSGPSRPEGREL